MLHYVVLQIYADILKIVSLLYLRSKSEELNLQQHRCENLKSGNVIFICCSHSQTLQLCHNSNNLYIDF